MKHAGSLESTQEARELLRIFRALQTSRVLLVSARTHSMSRYIYIQTFCACMRNVLRFLRHGTYHVVVRTKLYLHLWFGWLDRMILT